MLLTPLLLVAASLIYAQDGNNTAPVRASLEPLQDMRLITWCQFPNATYPNATSPDPLAGSGQGRAKSPPYYPSPWGAGTGDWATAYTKAQAFVSQLTLLEKVNLTTGVGWVVSSYKEPHMES